MVLRGCRRASCSSAWPRHRVSPWPPLRRRRRRPKANGGAADGSHSNDDRASYTTGGQRNTLPLNPFVVPDADRRVQHQDGVRALGARPRRHPGHLRALLPQEPLRRRVHGVRRARGGRQVHVGLPVRAGARAVPALAADLLGLQGGLLGLAAAHRLLARPGHRAARGHVLLPADPAAAGRGAALHPLTSLPTPHAPPSLHPLTTLLRPADPAAAGRGAARDHAAARDDAAQLRQLRVAPRDQRRALPRRRRLRLQALRVRAPPRAGARRRAVGEPLLVPGRLRRDDERAGGAHVRRAAGGARHRARLHPVLLRPLRPRGAQHGRAGRSAAVEDAARLPLDGAQAARGARLGQHERGRADRVRRVRAGLPHLLPRPRRHVRHVSSRACATSC